MRAADVPVQQGESTAETGRPGRASGGQDRGHARHAVQFYENESFLAETVAAFLGRGLAAGHPLLVIATADHRAAFTARLEADGHEVRRAEQRGEVTWLDARETLGTFMTDTRPDRERFEAAIGGAIRRALRDRPGAEVRAYGEMVDLLWRDGNPEGAIQLERLWNELAATHAFSLLCTYPLHSFQRAMHAPAFEEICHHHGHVHPTESFAGGDERARLREVSRLQQRAHALEAEVEHRKQLEEQLQRALAERERLLESERTARAAAESANRAKSDFLAMMSHELRTPLNAIGGYTDLMGMGIRGPLTPQQRDDLGRIRRSQQHLLGLIEEVLSYAQIEAGAVQFHIREVELPEAIASVEPLVTPQFAARRIAFVTVPPDGATRAPVARADREKVRQVLLNLLSNACKFTPPGGTVEVACGVAGDRVAVHVRDTGVGIRADERERIFEPFVQVDATYTRLQPGTGLGLPISRDLARHMGGDLTVESVLGRGSTFTLTLPRA